MNWLEFELMIMDMVEDLSTKDAEKIRDFADNLHQHMELAIEDWCYDNGIEDYNPVY